MEQHMQQIKRPKNFLKLHFENSGVKMSLKVSFRTFQDDKKNLSLNHRIHVRLYKEFGPFVRQSVKTISRQSKKEHYSTTIKFIHSKEATKFCKIFTLLLTGTTQDKSKVKISQNFVAFSEYMNYPFYCIKHYYLFGGWKILTSPSQLKQGICPKQVIPKVPICTSRPFPGISC